MLLLQISKAFHTLVRAGQELDLFRGGKVEKEGWSPSDTFRVLQIELELSTDQDESSQAGRGTSPCSSGQGMETADEGGWTAVETTVTGKTAWRAGEVVEEEVFDFVGAVVLDVVVD